MKTKVRKEKQLLKTQHWGPSSVKIQMLQHLSSTLWDVPEGPGQQGCSKERDRPSTCSLEAASIQCASMQLGWTTWVLAWLCNNLSPQNTALLCKSKQVIISGSEELFYLVVYKQLIISVKQQKNVSNHKINIAKFYFKNNTSLKRGWGEGSQWPSLQCCSRAISHLLQSQLPLSDHHSSPCCSTPEPVPCTWEGNCKRSKQTTDNSWLLALAWHSPRSLWPCGGVNQWMQDLYLGAGVLA